MSAPASDDIVVDHLTKQYKKLRAVDDLSFRVRSGRVTGTKTLMVLGREVPNPELQERVGFTLVGKERTQLRDSGYITSEKVGRPYVHELTDRVAAQAKEIRLGSGLDPETQMGPLISANHRKRVKGYVEGAAKEGAATRFVSARDPPSLGHTGPAHDHKRRLRER